MPSAIRRVLLALLLLPILTAQVNQTGQWSSLLTWPFVPVSVAHLADGRVVAWSSTQPTSFPAGVTFTYSAIYDPSTGQITALNNTAHDMFCAGLAQTGDGRIIASGGGADVRTTSTFGMIPRWPQTWNRLGDMLSGRWYNTSVTLPNGNLFTMWGRSGGTLTEIFDQNANTWSALPGITINSQLEPNDQVDDDNQWFPHLHLMPNGKIFMAGPLKTMRWLDFTGNGSWQDVGSRAPDGERQRKLSCTVQYLPGKLLTMGGRDDRFAPSVTNTAVLIDATSGGTPVVTAASPMNYARAFHYAVILPNGEVFVAGGNTSGIKFSDSGGVTVPEIWNPDANQWRTVAPMAVARGYHTNALLLRDGRVMVGGGGLCNCVADHPNTQIFSPGYLFNADGTAATRPAIDLVSPELKPGLTVGLKGSDNITGFRLIRLQATTHGINADQRYVPVPFTKVAPGSYNLTLDSNQNILIPGMYWLFAVTSAGTPSIGYPVQMFTPSTWPGGTGGETNLAKNKAATQSSTFNDSLASRAVDGNTNGDFFQNSVSHTQQESQPYWLTDLGARAQISAVRIWSRTDCCQDRLSNFHVFVSDVPFTGTTVAEVKAQAGVLDIPFAGIAPTTTTLAVNRSGRYVRVQLEGNNFLSLAEVEVLGNVITNSAPTVSLVSPANGATATAPASFTITANAADPDNNLARVEFYQGTTKLGEATAVPYTFNWANVAAGNYTLTARAIDTAGLSADATVNVVVNPPTANNRPPVVSISGPVDGVTLTAPAGFVLTTTASDPDGNLLKVEYFQGATKLGESTAAPYSISVNNLDAGTYVFSVKATDTLGLTATATINVRVLTRQLQSLKGVPVPEPSTINSFIKSRASAIALGKALFWDLQVSSDGTVACASCHFQAGADVRLKNQMNPGTLRTGNPAMTFDTSRSGSANGPNYVVKPGDFPRHVLSNPQDPNSAIVYQSKDVMGSHGVFLRNFTSAPAGAVEDACVVTSDPVFGANRRATPRNAPTVLNAVFNVRNFWDGRANSTFNGVDSFGPRNTSATIYRGTTPVPTTVALDNASLASQAMTAPLNSSEMSCEGRTWPEIGKRLLTATALARQNVATTDSVLGSFAVSGTKGLNRNYDTMVRAAFQDDLHSSATAITINGRSYSQIQANFSLFFGLAVQMYESTLVSDQAPIDNYFANYPSTSVSNAAALSAEAIAGMNVFNGKGRCVSCHHGPQLTNAGTPAREAAAIGALISKMRMANGDAGAYDLGFYNIGVRPAGEDLGVGAQDPFGNPLSYARQAKAGVVKDAVTVDTCTFELEPCLPLNRSSRDVVDGAFKTPTLRNVALTGPYFHNGSAATLEDVVDFYDRGGNATGTSTSNSTGFGTNPTNSHADIRPLALAAFEKTALVTFLKTALTDDRVLYERAPFDHPDLPLLNGQTGANTDLVLVPAVGSAGRAQPVKTFEEILAAGDLGLPTTAFPVVPTVTLTAPANGATFIAPASIALTATASITSGTVTQVEFYNGATLLGTATAAPYTFTWSNVAAGNYAITAKAIGSGGLSATSAISNITVSAPSAPTVSLTAPLAAASYVAPATVAIAASATTTQGTISSVEFYNGATLLGTATSAPYTFNWANVAAGNYTLTAKAIGSNGTSTTSSPVAITVTAPAAPSVSLTSPANGAAFIAPATVALSASATTTQGTVTSVEFYNGATLLGTSTSAPYTFNWANVVAGAYTLTAKAIGSNGTSTTSSSVSITVTAPAAPSVSLTAPANGATYTAPAAVTVTASATTTQGTISKVEFYNGATLLGTATASPFTYNWASVAAGTYALTAKAYGSNGLTTTSGIVNITVNPPAAGPVLAGRWPLDTVTTGLTPDTSGNNNNGAVNGIYSLVAGKFGQAMQFDPATGGVLTQRSAIDPTKSFTVSLWVNLASTAGTQTFVSLPASNVSNFFLQLGGWLSGGFVMDLYPADSTGAADYAVESVTKPAANTWYHVTGVYDATAKQVRIYVNGNLERQGDAPNGSFANTGPLAFGYAKWDGNRADGNTAKLDDVRVFGSALTSADILAIYNESAIPVPTVAITSPAANANFAAPAAVTITASATITQGTITGVEFYNGATLLGAATSAPYTYNWSNVAAGTYSLTAKAIASNGTFTTSVPVSITVAAPVAPAVALTAPIAGASFTAPATVTIAANATTTQGTISKVEFYNGATLLSTATSAPYTFNWTSVAAGTYSLTAKAYGSNGTTATSGAVSVTVTLPAPTVSITAPATGASFIAPAAVAITASATITQGTITSVEFYNGATLLGSATTAPYTFNWANVAAGNYTLTAKAIGSNGASTTSGPVSISVTAAAAPIVTLTAPANGATFIAPAAVTLTATATTTQGTISKVEFYNGATLLGTATTAPFTYNWAGVAAGAYALTAKAYGSNGLTTTSLAANITVNPPAAGPVLAGRWPLDTVTSGLTPDSSGNNNNGAVSGTYSLVAGKFGQAMQFDPATGGVLTQRTVIDPTKSFTVSLWVNLASTAGTQTFVSQPATKVSNFFLQLGGWLSGGFVMDLYPTDATSAADYAVESTTKPVANTWYHVTGVYDATAKQIRIYVNGNLERQGDAPNGSFANTGPLAFGYAKWDGNRADGNTAKLDDVRVFGSALTSADILSIYNESAIPVPSVSITSPAANANFAAPAAVTITASASITQGTISSVEFYNGATLLGAATSAPYTYNWSNVVAGTYSLTAKAIASNGTSTTSVPVSITVAAPVAPTVSLTSPTSGASFIAPAAVALAANATTTQGTISKVEFYNGATLLSTATSAPYTFSWANVAAGSYTLTAKAYGSNGSTATSATVSITVTLPAPTVSITAPATGASFVAPAAVAITASATITQGTITSVEFYNGATLLGSATTAPYTFNWANVASGNYTLTAKAIGSNGTSTTSGPVSISVTAAAAPIVALTAPANGATFIAPAAVTLTATAATTQGTISKVEFYNGATLLGTATSAPYSYNWASVAAGTYAVTAKAYGSNGLTTTSLAANITVNPPAVGPVLAGRWPLDTVASNVTADTSGNNNNGTVTGPFTLGAGMVGQAIQLDPATGGVLTQRAVVDPTKSFTVALWVNLANTTGTQTFVSLPATKVSNFYLQLGGWLSGGFVMDLYPTDATSAADYAVESTTKPVAGTWYHIAGVYDATAKQVRIYVNGNLERQGDAPNGSFANTGPLAFGYSKWDGARADGTGAKLDDIRVFGSALTTAEIQTVFAAR